MKYILLNYNLEGSSFADETGAYQPVTIFVGIEGETKGFVQIRPAIPIKLDPTLSYIELANNLPILIQTWVDLNYNS